MNDLTDLDATCINTIRTLAMDAVQQANSGHPGTPMALAPVAYCLWQHFLRFDPAGPDLAQPRPLRALGRPCLDAAVLAAAPDRRQGGEQGLRDARRAVGAAGRHQDSSASWTASARAIPSTAGPSGVETTTGPLGQGVANSVGMAIAGRWLAAHYNRPGFEDLFDFNVYAICGDGCMMEGISSRGRLAGRPPASSPTSAGSTTTTTSRSRATPPGLQRGRGRRGSSATAGTSPASATPTTWTMLERAFQTFSRRPPTGRR